MSNHAFRIKIIPNKDMSYCCFFLNFALEFVIGKPRELWKGLKLNLTRLMAYVDVIGQKRIR
jgi:hypothetical protein